MKREDQNNLSNLSLEELNKKAKTTKFITGLLGGVLLIQFAAGIYLLTQKGFNVFVVIPVAFLPIFLINLTGIKKINEEIARRKA